MSARVCAGRGIVSKRISRETKFKNEQQIARRTATVPAHSATVFSDSTQQTGTHSWGLLDVRFGLHDIPGKCHSILPLCLPQLHRKANKKYLSLEFMPHNYGQHPDLVKFHPNFHIPFSINYNIKLIDSKMAEPSSSHEVANANIFL